MAKAYSKAARLKAKKSSVKSLYDQFEDEVARAVPAEPQDDPQKAAIRARAIQTGCSPTKAMLDPALETEAGKAIFVAVDSKEERRELIQVFIDYDKCLTLFARRVLSRQRFPSVSKMEFMPERLETGAMDGISADLRTEEQKTDASKIAMRGWDNLLSQLHTWQANIIRSASYQQEALLHDGELTSAGRSFIAAIRKLTELTKQ